MDDSRHQELEKAFQDFKIKTDNASTLGLEGIFWMFCFNLIRHPVKTAGMILMYLLVLWMFINVSFTSGIVLACFFIFFSYFCKWIYWLFSDDGRRMKYKDFYFLHNMKKQKDFQRFAFYHMLKQHFKKYPDLDILDTDMKEMVEELNK